MEALTHTLFSVLGNRLWLAAAAFIVMIGAALAAYAKRQIDLGTQWVLAPVTTLLPWNVGTRIASIPLLSSVTLVEVCLLDHNGAIAQYRKTSSFLVRAGGVQEYTEAITTEANAKHHCTMRGRIARLEQEHGFDVATIQFEQPLSAGASLTNTFIADLFGAFGQTTEHWTQEIAYPTAYLTILIRFPRSRPPISVNSRRIAGPKTQIPSARIERLFGTQSIIWEIPKPELKDIYKVEWNW